MHAKSLFLYHSYNHNRNESNSCFKKTKLLYNYFKITQSHICILQIFAVLTALFYVFNGQNFQNWPVIFTASYFGHSTRRYSKGQIFQRDSILCFLKFSVSEQPLQNWGAQFYYTLFVVFKDCISNSWILSPEKHMSRNHFLPIRFSLSSLMFPIVKRQLFFPHHKSRSSCNCCCLQFPSISYVIREKYGSISPSPKLHINLTQSIVKSARKVSLIFTDAASGVVSVWEKLGANLISTRATSVQTVWANDLSRLLSLYLMLVHTSN